VFDTYEGFSLATVAEGKTIIRAAIPIMVNNSLLSEVYCQNNGQALNRNKDNNLCDRHLFNLAQSMPNSLPNNAAGETDHTNENRCMNANNGQALNRNKRTEFV
jgi:hypothetical protein